MVILERKGSEKQISVDPISVRESSSETLPPKFMSCSLPNSASSSPRFPKHKKKYKNHHEAPPPLARQHSVALDNLERLRETHLRRSKSCGEGRASQPSLDFDLCSPPVPRVAEVTSHDKGGGEAGDKFKCGACLFLPGLGLGKGSKTVRARKEVDPRPLPLSLSLSQRASLEKFECGSWSSSAVVNYEDDGDATSNLFFDLPVELIRCSSVNDTDSPVTTGFVFDNKDHHHHRKGVLKSTSTTHRESSCASSSRHVRFSTSLSPASPTSCITPRLHKARNDFNAFLEAQSA